MFWHRNIPLRFQRLLLTSFLPLIYSLLLILFKRITQIIFERKVCSHMFWHQNLLFGFKWLLLAYFEHKINFWLTSCLPLIFHSVTEVTVDLFFIINLLMNRFLIQKNLSDLFEKKKIILTRKSFIWVQILWLVLDLKWNFGLDLKHNIVHAFWET